MFEPLEMLSDIRDDYWKACFAQALAIGLIKDGHYDVQADRDLILSYCGA